MGDRHRKKLLDHTLEGSIRSHAIQAKSRNEAHTRMSAGVLGPDNDGRVTELEREVIALRRQLALMRAHNAALQNMLAISPSSRPISPPGVADARKQTASQVSHTHRP